jgi:cell division protein FtsI/penicillin-binding protein 2
VLIPALALPLAACSGPKTPPPDDVVESLAAALGEGDVSGLPLDVGASVSPQTQFTQVVEPLVDATGEREHHVSVAEIGGVEPAEYGAATATATLDWTWELTPTATWEYSTQAELSYTPPHEASASGDGEGEWQVVWRPDLIVPELAPGERLEVARLLPDRADILDGDGAPMVTARDVWHLGVDKTVVEGLGMESAARQLAVLVGREPNRFFETVKAAGDKAFVEAVTIRKKNSGVDYTVADALDIIGVAAVPDTLELGPTTGFAEPVLGSAGEATAEVIEESGGDVRQGDVVGLSGIQRDYEARLAGQPGVVVRVVPPGEADDDSKREVFRDDPVDGTPVATTLDVGMQNKAEKALAGVDPASAIVAVRPSTGEVLAAASGPGSEGWSTATLGKYPPGSTFKVVDGLAFQRAGMDQGTTVTCSPTLTVDGRTFSNVPGYPSSAIGDVKLRTAFAHSCNTAMIAQRDKVSQADLAAAAADLGLTGDEDVLAGIGVPAFLGSVPAEAGTTEHAASLIGQGKVEASPLGMATVAASVVAGEPVAPVLVRPEGDGDGGDAPSGVTEGEAKVLRDLMQAVVTEGSADMLRGVSGVLGAKTGTAQYGDGSRQHVWMLAIKKDLAVAVFVEDGEFGSTTAGPIMTDFLTSL